MSAVSKKKGAFSVKAYRGDAKTLLAFNLDTPASRKGLAGFTVRIEPPGLSPYYLFNTLAFEKPGDHAQDPLEPAKSSLNAPLHKFRWVHVPGLFHQQLVPVFGNYIYSITPRYFDESGSLQPLDASKSVAITIEVSPFTKGSVRIGFTRGFTQSQAYVRRFGLKARIKPKNASLTFDTSAVSGKDANGVEYSFAQQYGWLGFTARKIIFDLLDEVIADDKLSIDLFAYDLNEPDFVTRIVKLGKAGRARVILDDAALHHDAQASKPEDEFEALFAGQAGADAIKRGKFGRYAHNKVIIVYAKSGSSKSPVKVITGSTNFSVTGMYVNSNHVLQFDDASISIAYADVFEESWVNDCNRATFAASPLAVGSLPFAANGLPAMAIGFSPHSKPVATTILGALVGRMNIEPQHPKPSILFATMQLDGGAENPVYDALKQLHKRQDVFTYGVSDTPDGIALYPVGRKTGVLVTGKPVKTQLPPPFSQVPGVGLGHQIHHKFVVCGFNGPNPVVYCGSSNLALTGETVNGDNLIEIRDADIAIVFAIEALALVDHFDFLNRLSATPGVDHPEPPPAHLSQAAADRGWFLSTSDRWTRKYFDKADLHSADRELFA